MKSVRVTFWGEIGDRLGHERMLLVTDSDVTVAEIRSELAHADEAGRVLLKPQIRAAVDSVISPDFGSGEAGPGGRLLFDRLGRLSMAQYVRLEPNKLDAARELASFLSGRSADGAVVSFTGLARDFAPGGSRVTCLRLDWHPVMTERSLAALAEATARRFPVSDVAVAHRCGEVTPGETIVFVAVASAHRRQAFLAADHLMDRLKTEAMFWKHESGPDGERWVEPTEQDVADRARWRD